MQDLKKRLYHIKRELEQKYESPEIMIERLKREGKSMGQIEQEVLTMNRVQGAYDSIATALRILES